MAVHTLFLGTLPPHLPASPARFKSLPSHPSRTHLPLLSRGVCLSFVGSALELGSELRSWSRRFSLRVPSNRMRLGPQAMFTGLVEEMGMVSQVGSVDGRGFEMTIEASYVVQDMKLGDSIAVNGTCLTVTSFDSRSFSVGISPETLRRTSLGEASVGCFVNLERSVQPVSRMGGHFVQGHVDSTGTIISMEPEGDSLWVKVKTSPQHLRYIVPKGFIAVDGVSLTVVDVCDEELTFTFMLVAYTQEKVVITNKKVGSLVNLEVDILGKYVERLLEGYKRNAIKV
eukprot:c23168_g1_i1 orf=550-1404(-)